MKFARQVVLAVAVLPLGIWISEATGRVAGQTVAEPASHLQDSHTLDTPSLQNGSALPDSAATLFSLRDSDVKFQLNTLMKVLRDSRHEGRVLAAYPDPKTSKPLIGAGFSLDVAATEHPQSDALNPYLFLEPSSEQLWEAAGLNPERLRTILEQFDRDLARWKKKNYRKKIKTHALPPQITEEEATGLLRTSATQAIYNARAYCRNFDRLTSSQQMALSQLVFQMGVNLQEFVQFLSTLNGDIGSQEMGFEDKGLLEGEKHWRAVQQTLIDSQWARRYSSRAVSVIAMFDPDYLEDPKGAEHQVRLVLRPPKHHPKKPHANTARVGNNGGAFERAAAKTQ